jgi:hypothetical protein
VWGTPCVSVKMLTIREGAAAPMQLPGMPAGLPSASGLAAAQALFGAVQASVAEAKPNEDTEDDEPAKDALKTGKEVWHAPCACSLAALCLCGILDRV